MPLPSEVPFMSPRSVIIDGVPNAVMVIFELNWIFVSPAGNGAGAGAAPAVVPSPTRATPPAITAAPNIVVSRRIR